MTDKVVWPIGKYKNQDIGDIPDNYLNWTLDQDWFLDKYEDLSNKVVEELEFRKKWSIEI